MAFTPEEFRKRTRFVIKLGRALHDCGASSERIELHLTNVTRMLGLHGSFLISPTTFTCAFWEDDELDQFVHIERTDAAGYKLGKLWEIDRMVEAIEDDQMDFATGTENLRKLSSAPPNFSPAMNALAMAVTGAGFAALLSSNPLDGIASSIVALLLFAGVYCCSRTARWKPVTPILAALVAGLSAGAIASLGVPINPPFVILSSIIIFVPGIAFTVALTEISTGHLISGSSRLVGGAMTLLKLFFGALSGVALSSFLFTNPPILALSMPDLPEWRIWVAVVVLSFGLGIAFDIPWKKMPWGLLAAIIAFVSSRVTQSFSTIPAGVFIGALSVGLFSNLFARITKGPGSILTIYGIILLVPGSKIYLLLNHWLSGESLFPYENGGKALMALVSLIAGLLFSNALLPPRKSL
ncbi:threonine/serine exporter ThrE family protein [Haloferula chungangensis]|uniref:Threonine/serine exporter ThrE family protein n=1 Tax=Haloferula chungangensis TaxID=1048331 RepID=A0ABW2L2C3_9BACT